MKKQQASDKIPWVNFEFSEFSRINKFPEFSRFSRVVSTLSTEAWWGETRRLPVFSRVSTPRLWLRLRLLLLLLLQPFNSPLSWTTRVSWYQKTEMSTFQNEKERSIFSEVQKAKAWGLKGQNLRPEGPKIEVQRAKVGMEFLDSEHPRHQISAVSAHSRVWGGALVTKWFLAGFSCYIPSSDFFGWVMGVLTVQSDNTNS